MSFAVPGGVNKALSVADRDAMMGQISEMTGYKINISVPTNYAALIEAMGSGNAQIGWLPVHGRALPSWCPRPGQSGILARL